MGSCGLTVGGVRHTTLSMTPTYILLGCFLSFLHLGHTSSSSDLCKDTGCLTHFTKQGVEAQCVNVLYANFTSIGEKYDLSTAMEDGLCDGACCRCFKLRQHKCTDVTGSCRAAFGGDGSCIDARTGNLSNIDTRVKPREGLCGAGSDKCCQCFKLKTEDLTTTTTTTTTTTSTTFTATTTTTITTTTTKHIVI